MSTIFNGSLYKSLLFLHGHVTDPSILSDAKPKAVGHEVASETLAKSPAPSVPSARSAPIALKTCA